MAAVKVAAAADIAQTAAVRCARLLAGFSIDTAAAAAGVSRRHMLQALNATVGRGVCAEIATAAAAVGQIDSRIVALTHRACPPPTARRAGGDISVSVRRAGVGVAGWSARSSGHRVASRGVVAAVVASDPVLSPVAAIDGAQVAWLVHLAGRAHPDTRTAVAGHVQCPPMLLEVLAADSDRYVRKAVAENVACPHGLLGRLAAGSASMRQAVANNVACPQVLLERLACDDDPASRVTIAENPCCGSGAAGTSRW